MENLTAKFISDIEKFFYLRKNKNTMVEVIERAYESLINEISESLRDRLIHQWLDGDVAILSERTLREVPVIVAEETVDIFMDTLEIVNDEQCKS